MELANIKEVYFIGVGGIGMSAVARYFLNRGVTVTGYDKTETPLTRALESEGIAIHYGEARVDLIPEAAGDLLVVWTPAIPRDFPELEHVMGSDWTQAASGSEEAGSLPEAAHGQYVVLKRAQVLGLISREMDCIGIAGTHGKTTTTTITTHLMMTAGLSPHAFLGGIPRDFDGNYVAGDSNYVVVEADEYDRSFLNLHPEIAVILSADPDHLDIYGDHEAMLETGFRAYARRIKRGGHLIVRHDIAQHFTEIGHVTMNTFGIGTGDYAAQNIHVADGAFHFDLKEPDGHLVTNIRTALPGRHNIENAVAACAVTRLAGGDEDALRAGLASFRGIARRFETLLKTDHMVIIDDYAHHPTELTAAISAARELYPGKTIRGVFQPHLFSRTQDFAAGFAGALDLLDEAILVPIYPARELPIEGVTSRIIFERMKSTNKRLLSDEQMLAATAELTDGVLLLLGAGDIDALVPQIVAQHQNANSHG